MVEEAQISLISIASGYKKEYNHLLEELFKEVPSLMTIESFVEKLNNKYKQIEKLIKSTIMTPTLAEIYAQFLRVFFLFKLKIKK